MSAQPQESPPIEQNGHEIEPDDPYPHLTRGRLIRDNNRRARLAGRPAPAIEPGQVRQLLELQKKVFDDAMDRKTSVKDRAAACNAWDKLADRLRILRKIPLPGNLKPAPPSKERKLRTINIAPALEYRQPAQPEPPTTGSVEPSVTPPATT